MAGMVNRPSMHHRGADNAGRGCQDDTDHANRYRQTATHLAEQILHGRHHTLGNTGTIKHQPHENEHRQRHKDPVVHQLINAVDGHAVDSEIQPGPRVEIRSASMPDSR